MVESIIRTDKWIIKPSNEAKIYLQATVDEYRAFCKALSYVILGHWTKLQNVNSKCAVIVNQYGTVTARKFFHPSADIDRRDVQAAIIRKKARKTQKLHRGFCKSQYRKARNINLNISHQVRYLSAIAIL